MRVIVAEVGERRGAGKPPSEEERVAGGAGDEKVCACEGWPFITSPEKVLILRDQEDEIARACAIFYFVHHEREPKTAMQPQVDRLRAVAACSRDESTPNARLDPPVSRRRCCPGPIRRWCLADRRPDSYRQQPIGCLDR